MGAFVKAHQRGPEHAWSDQFGCIDVLCNEHTTALICAELTEGVSARLDMSLGLLSCGRGNSTQARPNAGRLRHKSKLQTTFGDNVAICCEGFNCSCIKIHSPRVC